MDCGRFLEGDLGYLSRIDGTAACAGSEAASQRRGSTGATSSTDASSACSGGKAGVSLREAEREECRSC